MHRFKGVFLLCSHWNRVKFLYVVTRYVPFFLFIAHLYCTSLVLMGLRSHTDKLLPVNFVPDETSDVRWLAIDKSPTYLKANLDMPICQ